MAGIPSQMFDPCGQSVLGLERALAKPTIKPTIKKKTQTYMLKVITDDAVGDGSLARIYLAVVWVIFISWVVHWAAQYLFLWSSIQSQLLNNKSQRAKKTNCDKGDEVVIAHAGFPCYTTWLKLELTPGSDEFLFWGNSRRVSFLKILQDPQTATKQVEQEQVSQ